MPFDEVWTILGEMINYGPELRRREVGRREAHGAFAEEPAAAFPVRVALNLHYGSNPRHY